MPSDPGVGEPLMLTYKQAIAKAGISMSQLYRAMRAGEITPVELGPRIRRITPGELDAYVARKKAESDAKRSAA